MSVKSSFENVTMVFMGGYLPNWIPAQKGREKVDSAPKDVKKSLSVREPIWLLAGSFAPQPLLLP